MNTLRLVRVVFLISVALVSAHCHSQLHVHGMYSTFILFTLLWGSDLRRPRKKVAGFRINVTTESVQNINHSLTNFGITLKNRKFLVGLPGFQFQWPFLLIF